jgi:hypothetical protein
VVFLFQKLTMAYLEIPYFNELTANQLGFSTEFDSNVPLSYVGYSLQSLGRYLQGQNPRIRTTRDWEEALRGLPGQTPSTTPPINDAPLKKCDDKSTWFDRISGRCCIGEVTADGKCRLRSDGKDAPLGDDPTHSGQKADAIVEALGGSKEAVIRIGILFLALIIFVLAFK